MNTLRLIRWRGERHASITQRLNFAAHATPEATLALVYAHESGLEPDEVRQARRAYGGNTIPAPGDRRHHPAHGGGVRSDLIRARLPKLACCDGAGHHGEYHGDGAAGRCRRAADSVRRACRGRHRDVVRRRHRPGRLQAAGEPRPAHRTWGRSLAKACPCARMLPLIVTVCLSRGARAMASGKAIVRRLDAIETLGGMDVLCVDKTGTLTSGAGAGTSGNVSRIMVVKDAVSEMLPRCDTVMRNGTAEPLTDRRLHPLARPRAHQTVARLDESGTIPSEPGNGCVIISKKTSAAPYLRYVWQI